MDSRRTFLTSSAAALSVFAAGCLDFITGDEALEFDANRVAPTDAALEATDYEQRTIRQERIEETVDVGVERDIHASYWNAGYTKELELLVDVDNLEELEDVEGVDDLEDLDDIDNAETREAAAFAAVSMPAMTVAGDPQNPLLEMDTAEIIEELRSEIEDSFREFDDVTYEGTTDLEILEDTRDVDRYVATTEFDDYGTVELTVHITLFENEDDVLILVGAYPTLVDEEEANIETLMASVEHPLDDIEVDDTGGDDDEDGNGNPEDGSDDSDDESEHDDADGDADEDDDDEDVDGDSESEDDEPEADDGDDHEDESETDDE